MSEPVIQNKPIAVLISDIHYNLQNLELCGAALLQAITEAQHLNIPLIIAGDLNDSKAIIRGEVANHLINILSYAKHRHVMVHIIPGNHDLLSVKSNEHSLNFLRPYADIMDDSSPRHIWTLGIACIPYQISNKAFLDAIEGIESGTVVICHQGFKGANLGAYFKDETSVDPAAVSHLRVISGHYHMHQDIGTVTYIGNPFTMSFAEANDGPKGFCVLYSDGSLKQVFTNLRKHIVLDRTIEWLYDPIFHYNPGDILKIKVTGAYVELSKIDKKALGLKLINSQDFILEKIYTDSTEIVQYDATHTTQQLLNSIIDTKNESDDIKADLKALWKELI